MPDNTRPPRNLHADQGPNLGTRALMSAIDEIAKTRKLTGARVAYKRNAKGEHPRLRGGRLALIFTGFDDR